MQMLNSAPLLMLFLTGLSSSSSVWAQLKPTPSREASLIILPSLSWGSLVPTLTGPSASIYVLSDPSGLCLLPSPPLFPPFPSRDLSPSQNKWPREAACRGHLSHSSASCLSQADSQGGLEYSPRQQISPLLPTGCPGSVWHP